MVLKSIFVWIYCMDFQEVLFLLAVFTWLFYVLRNRFAQHRLWVPAVVVILVLWAAVVINQTIFQRAPSSTLDPIWQPFKSYVDALKAGGQKELLRSNFMNAVLFYPAGLILVSLLPDRWKAGVKVLAVFTVFAGLSAIIEFTQYYYNLGLGQTDDVIHNTLGAILGAGVLFLIQNVIKYVKNPQR